MIEDSHSRKLPSTSPTTDRRLDPRYPVRPIEYIEVGENNGGIILDISEHGMAVSTAQALVAHQPLTFRFQLPRFPETIEALAKISWISETKKRAGIRFLDLPAKAHEQILKWINLQTDNAAVDDSAPATRPALAPDLQLLESPQPGKRAKAAKDRNKPLSTASESSFVPPAEREQEAGENFPPAQESQPDRDASEPAPERRSQSRKSLNASAYLQLNDGNGGLVANLSETGLSFRAAKSLESDKVLVRFQLPGSDQFIESPALIVWKSGSKKKVGARFMGLPAEARNQIAEWIAAQNPRDRPEPPASLAGISAANALPPAQALPAFLTGKPLPEVSPALHVAGQPVSAVKNGGSAVPWVLSTARKPAVSLPAETPSRPSRLDLPVPAPQILREPEKLAALPFPVSTTSDVPPDPALPRIYSETSWTVASKRSSGLWKILALMILLGGACFGAGVFFSRNRQIPAPSSGGTARSSVASSASQSGESADSLNRPLSKPAPAALNEVPAQAIRDAPKTTGNRRFAQSKRSEPFGDRPARDTQNDSQARDVERSRHAALTEPIAVRDSNVRSPAGSGSSPESAATGQNNAPAPASLAPGKPSPVTAAPQQVLPASGPSSTSRDSSAAVSSPAVPASVQNLTGSVSSFSRFRAIRNPGPSSKGAVLQIGTLISSPLPVYPVDALRRQVQGLVELDVMVGSEGDVQSVHFVKGPTDLAAAAMSAVREWRYAPTVLAEHRVETEQSILITFKLKN